MIVWEFGWTDLTLVVLEQCSSYRGVPLNRFDCILIYKKLNIYKTLYGAMPLHNIFDKVDVYNRTYDSTKSLGFFILMKNLN